MKRALIIALWVVTSLAAISTTLAAVGGVTASVTAQPGANAGNQQHVHHSGVDIYDDPGLHHVDDTERHHDHVAGAGVDNH